MTADNRPEALERVYAEAFNASQDADETTDAHDARIAGLLAVYRAGQNKWVSVKESLPENQGNYWSAPSLVLFDSGSIGIESVFYGATSGPKWFLTPGVTAKVTHWQPLPEPPQGDA